MKALQVAISGIIATVIMTALVSVLFGWPVMILVGILYNEGVVSGTLNFWTSVVVAFLVKVVVAPLGSNGA